MKRKFEGQELTLAMKGLANLEEEKMWNEYQINYHKLMLEGGGLEANHKKNIRDFKQKKHEFETELEIVSSKIKILQDQIRNGVDIIEKPKIIEEIKKDNKKIEQVEVKGGEKK